MNNLNNIFTCTLIFLIVYALTRKITSNAGFMNDLLEIKRNRIIIVSILFIIAIGVRVYSFGSIPGGFNQDGAMAAVDALALANHGTDRFGMWMPVHFTAWGYGQMSVLLSYCMIPFIKLFGLNPITARLPMLLASLVGIYALYWFCNDVFGRFTSIIVLFLAAINPWHIMQSRWALDCNLFPHFILFSLCFLYKGIQSKRYLYLSMLFFALTMYTYGIAFYTIPVMLILLCVYMLMKKIIDYKTAIICSLVYGFFAWPILAVMIINYFKWPTIQTSLFTIPFFPNSIRSNDLLFFSNDMPRQAVNNLYSLLNTAFFQFPDAPWNTIPEFGAMFLFNLPLLCVGFWSILNIRKNSETPNKSKDFGMCLIICWLLVAVFSGIIVNGVNVNRTNLIFYPEIILTALGISHILMRAMRRKFIFITVGVIYLTGFILFSKVYFGVHNEILSQYFYQGFGESVQYAEKLNSDILYTTSNTQSSETTQVSKILTEFYGEIDSQYMQGKAIKMGNNGQVLLPYHERYIYTHFTEPVTKAEKNVVYIYNINEKGLFSPDEFELVDFDYYGVAIPKK